MSARRLGIYLKPLLLSTGHVQVHKIRNFHRWVAPTLKELYKRKQEMGPQPPVQRSNFIEWNYKAELYAFGKRLGEEFQEDVLRQALTERSYIELEEEKQRKVGIEPQLDISDNADLACRGEKFIKAYTEQYLTVVLPSLPSDYICAIQEDLMKEENLAYVSKHIGIDDLVLSAEFPLGSKSLSQAFKAVVQALVESSGPDRASAFVRDFVITQLVGKDISPLCTPENPLRTLETTLGSPIESRLIAESGKNSLLANYQVGIYSNKKLVGRGCGESPQIAEEMAALDGLWRIWGIPFNRRPLPFKLELPPMAQKL